MVVFESNRQPGLENRNYSRRSSVFEWLSAFCVGCSLFFLVTGARILVPTKLNWLSQGPNSDPIQAYLGWEFYRASAWSLPLGSNEKFGDIASNSIAYSDSIPLLAIPLKLIQDVLPRDFQYFGIWILICFILGILFGIKILQFFTEDKVILLLGSILLTFTPILLSRTNLHFALTGQFTIFASLYLALSSIYLKKQIFLSWTLLLSVSMLIHGYLFVITLVFFIFDLIGNVFTRQLKLQWAVLRGFVALLILLFVGKAVVGYGASSPQDISSNFWGNSGLNLASPIYPNGWSLLFSAVPSNKGNVDTAPYLGLGNCLLIFGSMVLLIRRSRFSLSTIKSFQYVIYPSVFLFLFAVTNRISVGNLLFTISVPKGVVEKFSIFRASARFSWPLFFMVIVIALIVVVRSLSKKQAGFVLAILAILQIGDTYPGWSPLIIRNTMSKEVLYQTESDQSWQELSRHYSKLIVLPTSISDPPGWPKIAIIAAKFGFSTNCAYLARVDAKVFLSMKSKIERQFLTGKLDPSTVYVLIGEQQLERAREIEKNNSQYKILEFDGLKLLESNASYRT